MKFILNENVKFILEERFILHEGNADVTAKSYRTVLTKSVEKLLALLEAIPGLFTEKTKLSGLAAQINKIETETTHLRNSLQIPFEDLEEYDQGKALYEIYKELVKRDGKPTYLASLKDILTNAATPKKVVKKLTPIFQKLESLSKVLPQGTNKKTGTEFIRAKTENGDVDFTGEKLVAIRKELQQVPKLLDQVDNLIETALNVSDTKASSTKVEDFKKNCAEAKNFFDTNKEKFNIEDDALKELANTEEGIKKMQDWQSLIVKAKEAYKAFTANMEGIPADEPAKLELANKIATEIDTYSTNLKAIVTTYTEVLKSSIYVKPEDDEEPEDETVDWQAKFLMAPASAKPKVVEEFIYKTWPLEATKILEIGEEVLAACKAFGFATEGANENPLLHFINSIYLKYGLTKEKYRAIHNAMADKLIKKDDFFEKGTLGKGNLIFCKALYALDPAVITGYIQKQAVLLRARTKPDRFATVADMTFSAIYAVGEEVLSDASTKSSAGLPLRALDKIDELAKEWTGEAPSTPEEEVASDSELVAKIADKGKETAIDVIVALVLKFSSEKEIVEAAKKCVEVNTKLSAPMTPIEMAKLLGSSGKYIPKKLTAADALKVITGLTKSEKLGLTTTE